MDVAKLIALRPKGASVAEHQSSLDRIDSLAAETQAKIAELRALRPKILLTAGAAEIQNLEHGIANFEIDLEQLQGMREAVLPQLAAAQTAERHERARNMARQAALVRAAASAWVDTEYPALVDKIIEGFNACDRAIALVGAAIRELDACPEIKQAVLDEVSGLGGPPNPGRWSLLAKPVAQTVPGTGIAVVWRGDLVRHA